MTCECQIKKFVRAVLVILQSLCLVMSGTRRVNIGASPLITTQLPRPRNLKRRSPSPCSPISSSEERSVLRQEHPTYKAMSSLGSESEDELSQGYLASSELELIAVREPVSKPPTTAGKTVEYMNGALSRHAPKAPGVISMKSKRKLIPARTLYKLRKITSQAGAGIANLLQSIEDCAPLWVPDNWRCTSCGALQEQEKLA